MAEIMRDSVLLVKDALQAAIGNSFQDRQITYYDGDPGAIPASNLPAIIVELARDDMERDSTAEHDVADTIIVRIVFDKRDDWANDVSPTNLTSRKIQTLMSALDAATGRFLPNTVKGVLARGIDGNQRLGRSIRTEYGTAVRPNKSITSEGQVTFTVLGSVYTN
jgi:hypothetical protein